MTPFKRKLTLTVTIVIVAFVLAIVIPNVLYWKDRGWSNKGKQNQSVQVQKDGNIFNVLVKNNSTMLFIDTNGIVKNYAVEYDNSTNIFTLVAM